MHPLSTLTRTGNTHRQERHEHGPQRVLPSFRPFCESSQVGSRVPDRLGDDEVADLDVVAAADVMSIAELAEAPLLRTDVLRPRHGKGLPS
jgi:hypothetical protein